MRISDWSSDVCASDPPGDDFAMMREVLARRFRRALKEDPDRDSANWPDLILIDGGPGQLSAAQEVLAALGIGDLAVAAISKGPERNAGREHFHVERQPSFMPQPNAPVPSFLPPPRDEAHRFANRRNRPPRPEHHR